MLSTLRAAVSPATCRAKLISAAKKKRKKRRTRARTRFSLGARKSKTARGAKWKSDSIRARVSVLPLPARNFAPPSSVAPTDFRRQSTTLTRLCSRATIAISDIAEFWLQKRKYDDGDDDFALNYASGWCMSTPSLSLFLSLASKLARRDIADEWWTCARESASATFFNVELRGKMYSTLRLSISCELTWGLHAFKHFRFDLINWFLWRGVGMYRMLDVSVGVKLHREMVI